MLSAHDIARELRDHLDHVGDVKIHKLLYYCQGWNLTWTGEPLFQEAIEAWANGPVIADLWHDEKRDRPRPDPQEPTDQQRAVIDYVLGRYGRSTGKELIRRTHDEDPWREVSEADDPFAMANPEITHDSLIAWFSADEEYISHRAESAELRKRRDIYGFEGPAMPLALHEATLEAIARSR